MCVSIGKPQVQEPPKPEPIPKQIRISGATTKQDAPLIAGDTGSVVIVRKRTGRGTLRIPLASSGLTRSGLNLPNS